MEGRARRSRARDPALGSRGTWGHGPRLLSASPYGSGLRWCFEWLVELAGRKGVRADQAGLTHVTGRPTGNLLGPPGIVNRWSSTYAHFLRGIGYRVSGMGTRYAENAALGIFRIPDTQSPFDTPEGATDEQR